MSSGALCGIYNAEQRKFVKCPDDIPYGAFDNEARINRRGAAAAGAAHCRQNEGTARIKPEMGATA